MSETRLSKVLDNARWEAEAEARERAREERAERTIEAGCDCDRGGNVRKVCLENGCQYPPEFES